MKIPTVLLLLALFMSLSSIQCINTVPEGAKIEVINKITEDQILIADITVSGTHYYFLLDTDSELSFIDYNFAKKQNLPMVLIKNKPNDSPYITSPYVVQIMGVNLHVKDFSDTKASIKAHTGKEISGILGNDVIYSTNSKINFRKDIYEKFKEQ